MSSPRYAIRVFDATAAGFGPGDLIAEFERGVNLGYARYLNDVGEAFFTVSQTDPKVKLLRDYRHNAHVRIYRNGSLVWGGILGEWDANARDAIIYAYGYESLLYLVSSDWNVLYTNEEIGDIVTTELTRAKNGLTNSRLGWITMGTIQNPVTTSNGSTAIVLPAYRMFYKRYLFMMKELAAIAIGDTTNTVVFEITADGTFNFWKDAGSNLSDTWEYGDGIVMDFRESNVPVNRRSTIKAVGINPADLALRDTEDDSTYLTTYGRAEEPIFFSWVRDSIELDRVTKLRLARAVREDQLVELQFYPGKVLPAGAGNWDIADRINVRVNRGLTNVDGSQLIYGAQTVFMHGVEYVRALVQEPNGV